MRTVEYHCEICGMFKREGELTGLNVAMPADTTALGNGEETVLNIGDPETSKKHICDWCVTAIKGIKN